jgi:hypothetical protein
MRAVRMLMCFAAIMFVPGLCLSDDTGDSFFAPEFHFTLFGGAGLTGQSGNATHGGLHLGGSLEVITAVDFEHKQDAPFGLILEFGYAGPVNELGDGSALLSVNYAPELVLSHRKRLSLFATAGYTRLFGTGNALNYGGGLNFYNKGGTRALRLEVRDYLRFAGFKEHSAALRIGYLFCGHQQ